ncbi:NAD(P)H-binding protein [Baekduia sp. Peel2402]|uniref:NAD(P)H-binding protein n=1 Tax=Baekduia sp. Peel2402 TaxID=3458296 RepID=UPI00403ECB11
MSLIITGASGHLGRRTAELLLDTEGVDASDVVLVTRDPSKLDDLAARGATVRAGDFSRPETLEAAFAGATRVLIVSTDVVGARVPGHKAAIDAAQAAGAQLIAYTSLPNPVAANPAGVAADHRQTEEAVQASGIPYTFLRNALYAEYQIPGAQAAAASGKHYYNSGDGKTAYVSREDCAAAAAAVLAGGDEHANKAYDITGPELLGGADLARIYGAEPVAIDDDAFAAALPPEIAPLLVSFGVAIREGFLDQRSDDVEALTGRAPTSVADVLAAAGATA